jgi:hypothetical protein
MQHENFVLGRKEMKVFLSAWSGKKIFIVSPADNNVSLFVRRTHNEIFLSAPHTLLYRVLQSGSL